MNAETSAKIDSYIFGEMSEPEQGNFEQQLLANNDFFYEVAERENALVDAFVRGGLEDSVAKRFRDSLAKFPARRAKVSNASLLKVHIDESRSLNAAETNALPWYRRLGFAFQVPALAASALAFLLVGTVGFLLIQNRNLNQQVASLNSNNQDLNQLRQREAELQAELESMRTAGSDLTTDLESERERRQSLETELSKLRNQLQNGGSANDSPIVPTIATLVLRPMGTRGGPGSVRRLRLDNDEKRVALKIELPADRAEGLFLVRVNDISAASAVKPNRQPGGVSSLAITVPSESFRNGLNRVEVFDSNSQNVASFAVVCERGPVR
jgi:hypothetical protein